MNKLCVHVELRAEPVDGGTNTAFVETLRECYVVNRVERGR